jgi:hypothetical protein
MNFYDILDKIRLETSSTIDVELGLKDVLLLKDQYPETSSFITTTEKTSTQGSSKRFETHRSVYEGYRRCTTFVNYANFTYLYSRCCITKTQE